MLATLLAPLDQGFLYRAPRARVSPAVAVQGRTWRQAAARVRVCRRAPARGRVCYQAFPGRTSRKAARVRVSRPAAGRAHGQAAVPGRDCHRAPVRVRVSRRGMEQGRARPWARPVEQVSPRRVIHRACRLPGRMALQTAARMCCRTSSRPATVVPRRRSRRLGLCRRAVCLALDPGQGGCTETPAGVKPAPAPHRPVTQDPPRRVPVAAANLKERPRSQAALEVAGPPERDRISIRCQPVKALPATISVPPQPGAIWRPNPTPGRPPAH
jgi:hypothetical protein